MARIAKKTRAAKEMSGERRLAFARAAARLLRRRGPIPTAQLLALLNAEGLSVTEALSVVNHGFSHQLLMRDPGDAGGIAAGTASLPASKRAVVTAVLTAPSSKRKPHRRKAAATSSIDD
ncbi:MAG: hypothetical protein ACMG6S_28030 [Byssovorax sp.]